MRVPVSRRPLLALALTIAVGASSCSPLVRLQVRFVMPTPAATALTVEKFHLVGAKTCPPGPVRKPRLEADGDADSADFFNAEIGADGIHALVAFRGRLCTVRAFGWYDSNGDGVLNAGDYAGTSVAVEAADRGIFRGNITAAPDVALAQVR